MRTKLLGLQHKRRLSGGLLGLLGYLLSPLSFWNDAVINIPLAYACAWLVSLVYRPAFLSAFIFGYWMTNIAGLVLLHKGAAAALRRTADPPAYGRTALLKDLAWSLAYTALIFLLIKFRVLKPVGEYF